MGTSFFTLKKADDENSWFYFSSDQIKKLFLSDPSANRRRALEKRTILIMDNRRNDGMDPALEFVDRLISGQIPKELELACLRDENASFSLDHQGGAETARMTIKFECLFAHPSSGKVFSAGNIEMDFKMHNQKINGMWGYELEGIKTDTEAVAAFFSNNPERVQNALEGVESNLDYQEMVSHSRTLNQRY